MPVTAPIEKKAVQGSDGEPRRVLFVCTGNTCRSPMAAALYNDMQRPREFCTACEECAAEESLTPTNAVALSAGLYVSEGAPISEEAVTVLREACVMPVPGNDYTAHRAQPVTQALMESVDEVIAISSAHAMELMMRFPEQADKIHTLPMDVPDPYGRGLAAYRDCLSRLRYYIQLYGAMGAQS